jgi:hypothetical protein
VLEGKFKIEGRRVVMAPTRSGAHS